MTENVDDRGDNPDDNPDENPDENDNGPCPCEMYSCGDNHDENRENGNENAPCAFVKHFFHDGEYEKHVTHFCNGYHASSMV